jgi:hypothetical protein
MNHTPSPVYRRRAIDSREFDPVPEADLIQVATVGSLEVAFVRTFSFLDAICLETGDLLLSLNATRMLHESLVPAAKKHLHNWDAAQTRLHGAGWNERRVERRGTTINWLISEIQKEQAPGLLHGPVKLDLP